MREKRFLLWREDDFYGSFDTFEDAQTELKEEMGDNPEEKCYDEFRVEEVEVLNTWYLGLTKKEVVKTVFELEFKKQ